MYFLIQSTFLYSPVGWDSCPSISNQQNVPRPKVNLLGVIFWGVCVIFQLRFPLPRCVKLMSKNNSRSEFTNTGGQKSSETNKRRPWLCGTSVFILSVPCTFTLYKKTWWVWLLFMLSSQYTLYIGYWGWNPVLQKC